jgi:hypothetical protein
MALGLETWIFYLALIDSLGAIVIAFFFAGWFKKNYRGFWKHFPTTKGWALIYFILVLWVGSALNRLGLLGF